MEAKWRQERRPWKKIPQSHLFVIRTEARSTRCLAGNNNPMYRRVLRKMGFSRTRKSRPTLRLQKHLLLLFWFQIFSAQTILKWIFYIIKAHYSDKINQLSFFQNLVVHLYVLYITEVQPSVMKDWIQFNPTMWPERFNYKCYYTFMEIR